MDTRITVTRDGGLLRLRTVPLQGIVYELCEDIGLDQWEGRHWREDSEEADLVVGRSANEVTGSFPEAVVDLFFKTLRGDAVSEARAEPLRRLRALIEEGRWHEASKLSVRLSLDPYVSTESPEIRQNFTQLAQAAAQIAFNEYQGMTDSRSGQSVDRLPFLD